VLIVDAETLRGEAIATASGWRRSRQISPTLLWSS
jgi:hypothetical protein